VPVLNRKLRLFVAAEEIDSAVARVCSFLRVAPGLDVNCVEFRVHATEGGEVLIHSDRVVGQEDVAARKGGSSSTRARWSGEKPVKQIVWDAAQKVAARSASFAPRDVCEEVLAAHPGFNKSTVGCQIIADCVNHSSRHHYPGGEHRYWWVEKGCYELYDSGRHRWPADGKTTE